MQQEKGSYNKTADNIKNKRVCRDESKKTHQTGQSSKNDIK
jgi:hypothetical protein